MLAGDYYFDLYEKERFDERMEQVLELMLKLTSGSSQEAQQSVAAMPDLTSPGPAEAAHGLNAMLDSLNLQAFARVLLANGIDDFQILHSVGNDDLQKMGFRVGHIAKIRAFLADPPPST
jgi:hypothetical protein